MDERIDDRNLIQLTPLVPPRVIKERLPLDPVAAAVVRSARQTIRAVLQGNDPRLVIVVGPCSIHDRDVAVDYAQRLKRVAEATRPQLVVVMRTYFEKPRTTVGWKGLINDPRLDGSCDISAGLALARSILREINQLGLPCASELLDPITPQYVADLLSWVAVGARTTESQTHREMASGLSMPVGFKNTTDGGLQAALNAVISARHSHTFLGIDVDGVAAAVKTTGNPDCHIVLRGGEGRPNYSADDISRAAARAAGEGIRRPIMVDCSHDNSSKDHLRQAQVCREVLAHVAAPAAAGSGDIPLMGLMLESNLEPGKQAWKQGAPLRYGVSITDACMGWTETEALLYEMAATVAALLPTPCATDKDVPFDPSARAGHGSRSETV